MKVVIMVFEIQIALKKGMLRYLHLLTIALIINKFNCIWEKFIEFFVK